MKFLTYRDVKERTSLSQSTIRRKVRSGEFPSPKPIFGGHRVVFLAEEVDSWMQVQIGLRSNGGFA